MSNETIHITTESNEEQIAVSIALTSLTVQDDNEEKSGEFLSKISCCNALNAMHSVRWFQVRRNLLRMIFFHSLSSNKSVNVRMLQH